MLKEYILEDPVRHTFTFNEKSVFTTLYNNDKQFTGYICDIDQYLCIHLRENVTKENLDMLNIHIKEKLKNDKKFEDFTCDELTTQILMKQDFILNDFELNICYLASLNVIKQFDLTYDFETIRKEDREKMIKLNNICFDSEKKISKDIFNEEEINNSIALYDKDELIFYASNTGINNLTSMIVGVCTHPSYRGRNIATQGVSLLCKKMLENNCTPVLFYNNPIAAQIYLNIGFIPTGYQYNIFKAIK